MKCIVKGCTNHTHEGMFVGNLCKPCHMMLTTGKLNPSNAWFVKDIKDTSLKVERLEEVVEMQRGWINILRMDIKNLLNAETTEEFGAAKNCLASSLKTYAGEIH